MISGFLSDVKEPIAREAIAYLRRHAPDWLPRIRVREGSRVRHRFWQPGGGYDRNIAGGSTLRRVMDYIHANPVRRGLVDVPLSVYSAFLVERPEDWEWSSARWHAGIHPSLIEMDRTLPADLDDRA